MKKLSGTLKITVHPAVEGARAHYGVVFVPYVGRMNTPLVKVQTHEELGNFLVDLRLAEDDAMRWAGKARIEGIVLISPFEASDTQLKEAGLLV